LGRYNTESNKIVNVNLFNYMLKLVIYAINEFNFNLIDVKRLIHLSQTLI